MRILIYDEVFENTSLAERIGFLLRLETKNQNYCQNKIKFAKQPNVRFSEYSKTFSRKYDYVFFF